jgi:hypothetical protein
MVLTKKPHKGFENRLNEQPPLIHPNQFAIQ